LRPHCTRLVVAPGSLDAKGWLRDAAIAHDLLPVKASVAGIHAAIVAAQGNVVALAWDMPFVPSPLIGELARHLTGSVAAVVPVVGGRPEPLCAAYARAAAEPIADAVKAGVLRNADVLERLSGVVRLEENVLRRFGDPAVMFFNVNTPADLARAEDIAKTL
jgi:molybdopterin-guanine dinucleotide biosynthesis protein A